MLFLIIFILAVTLGIVYLIVDVRLHKKSLIASKVEAEVAHFDEVKEEVITKVKADTKKGEAAAKTIVAEVEAEVKKTAKKVTKNK